MAMRIPYRKFVNQLLEQLDSMYGFAIMLSRTREEAEDLVQQTCMKAIENASRCNGQGNFKAWLFTILKNAWLNRVRELSSHPNIPFDEFHLPAFAFVLPQEDEALQISAALASLPLEQREIIVLRDMEGFTYDEIASILECPPGTVMSRLHRARAQLRKLLEGALR
jgi:RNA polymerase sigma-70 factor, ECF subfamily